MAATLKGKGAISLGKRLTNQNWATAAARDPAPLPPPPAGAAARRGVRISSYDKNPDDHVPPGAVPDDLISPQSDKYWTPHPDTGIFGPTDSNPASASGAAAADSSPGNGGGTALDQTARFRPQDDVDVLRPHA